MDDALFDRWTRGLADVVTRRGLGGLAVGALATAGWADSTDAIRSPAASCCMPTGSRAATSRMSRVYCCGGGWKFDQPGNFDAPGACGVRNDWAPLPGETADACCDGAYLFEGRCALPPGHTCYQDHFSLCWDGSRCNGSRCPDA